MLVPFDVRCLRHFATKRLMVICCNVQDVFLVDTNKFCFVWIGGGASPTEKRSGLGYAHVRRHCTTCSVRLQRACTCGRSRGRG